MNKDNINIGIVSKGRLKNFTENLLRKRKLKIFSERGERDLFGKIKGKSNIRVLFLHAREIIEQLSIGNLDIGISGYDLLKESEINIQKKINLVKRLASQNPDKEIFCLDPIVCPCATMYRIHPAYVLWVLDGIAAGLVINQVEVDFEERINSKIALDRMLNLPK